MAEKMFKLTVLDHPLVAHKITLLRNKDTNQADFGALVDELVTLLAYEATRTVAVESVDVLTPLALTSGVRLTRPHPVVVPVLRAGLGMLEGFRRLLPTASVGFVGAVRDEKTAQPTLYSDRLGKDLSGRSVFVLDPMLATGGTLCAVLDLIRSRGGTDVTVVCILAAPEGVAELERRHKNVNLKVVVGAVDEKLDNNFFITPGLGDAGDRLYGIV